MAKLSLRDIRKRITSVRSTQQITKAMKMVATAKLRRAQENIVAMRPYAMKISEVLKSLVAQTPPEAHPLLTGREAKRVELVLFTSDRGLCGAYNINLIQKAEKFLREQEAKDRQVVFSFVGRKGRDYFRKRKVQIQREFINFFGRVDYSLALRIGQDLVQDFIEKQVDAIYLLYSGFRSAVQQQIIFGKIFPVISNGSEEEGIGFFSPSESGQTFGGKAAGEYLYEPSQAEILDKILPLYGEVQVYRGLLESLASEYGARMTAMENATNNAAEMIEKLTLVYNKARQAAITKELIEIVSGAEALK
jgi:F-type H+-transporting ATPase subunit gamma